MKVKELEAILKNARAIGLNGDTTIVIYDECGTDTFNVRRARVAARKCIDSSCEREVLELALDINCA